jgi:hypothetical protein
MKKFILLFSVLFLLACSQKNGTTELDVKVSEPETVQLDVEVPAPETESYLVDFIDEELGFAFIYPNEWGRFSVELRPGEEGEMVWGEFSNVDIMFGGLTSDYIDSRGGTIFDTRGFAKNDEEYFFSCPKTPECNKIEPVEVLRPQYFEDKEILLLDGNSFVDYRSPGSMPFGPQEGEVAALLNLDNQKFSGIMWLNKDTQKVSVEEFKEFLESLIIPRYEIYN